MDRQQRHRWVFTAVNLIAFAALLYVSTRLSTTTAPKEVSYSDFLNELRAGHLSDVQITERELIGLVKNDSYGKRPSPEARIKATRLPGVDESLLLKELEDHQVKFSGEIEQTSWIWTALGWLLPLFFIVLIYRYGMRRLAQGGRRAHVRHKPRQGPRRVEPPASHLR